MPAETAAMNRPAKLGRNPLAGNPTKKPHCKPTPNTSRNPLAELSNGHPPPHSWKANKGSCFGFLLPNSSSSSSSSSYSSRGPQPKWSSLHGTPGTAPSSSRTQGPLRSHREPPGFGSRATQEKVPRDERPGFGNLKQSRSDKHQNPTSRSILQWRKVGSEGRPWKKKDAGGRGQSAVSVGKPQGATFGVEALEGGNGAPVLDSTRGREALGALISEVRLGFDLEEGGAPLGELFHGSALNATPGKEVEQQEQQERQQLSHSPASARTATPPVQASISPELGAQSVVPTPACFAAGYLIAGVQDRRKCRPRGILNGGRSGVGIADGGGLGSFDAAGNGCSEASLTPPPPVEASVHWLSSPCDDESGRLRSSTVSSSNRKVYLGACPAEASVNWFLSPLEDATDACVPFAVSEITSSSLGFGSLVGIGSSNFENTPSAVEICCSPTTNSSVSPFSMIIQKAAGSARCKDHSLRSKGRYRYGSFVSNLLFSGDSHGCSNVICTPSSCSCPSRQVGSLSTFDVHAMGEAVETASSSSPLWKVLANESEDFLPLSARRSQSRRPSTPSNSVSLACFRRPLRHQNSLKEEILSSSQLRISWREGLISRIFEMDEFNHNAWLSDKENADCHGGDELNLKLDIKFDQKPESPMIKEVTDQFTTNGFGSFEFVGHKQSEAKFSSPIPISCAESTSIEVDGLVASDDSDWTLFFKNHLFEV